MRSLYSSIIFILFSIQVSGQIALNKVENVSYQGILTGKYHHYLSENQEYLNQKESYQLAVRQYNYAQSRLDSLRNYINSAAITSYVRVNSQEILDQAGNQVTGDVYKSLRNKGMDFALVLNDIIPLSELYYYDRAVVLSKKEIDKAIEWSKSMAEVSAYFNHLFQMKKLNQPVGIYNQLRNLDKEIDSAFKEFKKNGYRLSNNHSQYESMFNIWQTYEEELRLGKDRKAFFNTLEKKFGKIIEKQSE